MTDQDPREERQPLHTARPVTPFARLKRVHALMVAGEAIMAIALADSLFLSISPDAARSKVLLFLAVSMAPFAIVAPLIGPAVDRMRGGQRLVVILVSVVRAGVMVAMMFNVDSLWLFPLAFAALILAKGYSIAKSALVPTTVSGDAELIRANSSLGQVAGIVGFLAAIPAGILQLISTSVTLGFGALVFLGGGIAAFRLPRVVLASSRAQSREVAELHSPQIVRAAYTMRVLRACVGFMFFHMAFWLRGQTAGTLWFGFAVACASLCTLAGNTVAPALRSRINVESMLLFALVVIAAVGCVTGYSGSLTAGIILVSVVNGIAAIGRLAFESIVQRDAPDANRGRAFARFETQNQLAWVLGGLLPVLLTPSGHVGFFAVGVAGIGGLVMFVRLSPGRQRAITQSRSARATGPEHRSRSESEDRRRD